MVNQTEYKEIEKVNPFLAIWLSPKKTVRYVLEHKDLKYSLVLAAIAGIPTSIGSGYNLGISFWWMVIAAIVFGPILGIIGLGIGTVIYTWVGKWFGGVGSFKEMAQAMGVVVIPNIWLTPYWIISAVINYNQESMTTSSAIIWLLVTMLIMLPFGIWMLVIQSKAIGEVHQFSSWRGFATLIIPSILFGIIIFIFVFILIFSILG